MSRGRVIAERLAAVDLLHPPIRDDAEDYEDWDGEDEYRRD